MSSRNLTQKVKYQNLNSEYIGLLTAQDLFSQRLQLLFSGDTKVHWPKLRWRLEVSDLYQVIHLISYLITHILNSTCISLTTNQKVLNCDHRHSSRSNPWNIIICVPSKRRSKNIPIYDLMRIFSIKYSLDSANSVSSV